MLALTGLVILYTEPIQQALNKDLRSVEITDRRVSLDDQLAAVERAHPNSTFVSVTPPKESGRSSRFTMQDSNERMIDVYVDPSNGKVLGSMSPGSDIVALANRLHGNINNESIKIPVPTIAGALGPHPLFSSYPLGDLLIEIAAGWGLVLAFTGFYLWWPRKRGTGKALLVPRFSKSGRARRRDLHAVGGILLVFFLIFFTVTGLAWSGAWGGSWSWIASKVTPNSETSFWEWEGPRSAEPLVGDIDREGNRIPWATRAERVPASGGPHSHGDASGDHSEHQYSPPAKAASLDVVQRAADAEGMLSGYTINAPTNVLPDPKDPEAPSEPFWGPYVVFNPWPSDMANQAALYLDQFSGATLATSTADKWGKLQWLTEFGVQNHMGTQFGIVTRILMTLGCLLLLWNVGTALAMWNARRRKRTLGLPRRPVDVGVQRVLGITALVLGVIYPLWGTSLVAVLMIDRYLIRRHPRLRATFGMQ